MKVFFKIAPAVLYCNDIFPLSVRYLAQLSEGLLINIFSVAICVK